MIAQKILIIFSKIEQTRGKLKLYKDIQHLQKANLIMILGLHIIFDHSSCEVDDKRLLALTHLEKDI